jgi:Raf kinase inhibitor-like YbhB/YbcL family protein
MNTEPKIGTLQLRSSAFSEAGNIPVKYSGQGEGISPPLAWEGAPAGVQSFALIVDDPDAPLVTFVHWVIFNLPPTLTGLPENIAHDEILPDGSRQGKNTLQKTGFTPPMPPTHKPHRYYFKLYALDSMLDLEPRCSKKELLAVIEGHVLAEGQLMGIYQKQ